MENDFQRWYCIGGLTIHLKSDLPITNQTFARNISLFQICDFKNTDISLHHHFDTLNSKLPNIKEAIYNKVPWIIYKTNENWIYYSVPTQIYDTNSVSYFDLNYSKGEIFNFNPGSKAFLKGDLGSLTLYPTDQILLSQLLSDRSGCYIHSSGIVYDNNGFLFVGHSGAGKSTIVKMLRGQDKVLCDDRIILRKWPDGFRIHGTWSHGEIPEVSPNSAPLTALFFLEKANTNRIIPLSSKDVARLLPFYIVKPLVTANWWEKTLSLVENVSKMIPAYRLEFDKSGAVQDLIHDIAG